MVPQVIRIDRVLKIREHGDQDAVCKDHEARFVFFAVNGNANWVAI
jgi:hypothetical protein